MELSGITHKLEANADKLGIGIGFLGVPALMGGGNVLGYYQNVLQGLATNPHVPDFGRVFQVLTDASTKEGSFFMGGIEAAIIGWILKEVDISPMLGRIGNVAQKAGIGAAEATAALTVIEYAGAF